MRSEREPEINADGQAVTFPLYCRGCGRTTWYQPGDHVSSLRDCCRESAMSQCDPGTSWWKAFHQSSVEQGREMERALLIDE